MAGDRALRRRCDRLLATLGLHGPLDVAELCARLAEQRGRPLHLVSHPIPVPGPFGCWISTATADYVLYQRHTTRRHQDHIILHEVGHIVAGHEALAAAPPPQPLDPSVAGRFPDIDPQAVHRALHRNSYSSDHEREAEAIATTILQRAAVLDRIAGAAPDAAGPTGRIAAVLSDPGTWL